MKNKIIVLMALMIVGLMAGSAAASDWEATSGLNITEVTLESYNETIDSLNLLAENGISAAGITTNNVEKMDNIDRVPLIYLGGKNDFSEKWDINVNYEYIFGEVEQSFSSSEGTILVDGNPVTVPSGENDGSIAVDLHGIAALGEYELTDNWYARGGIGFYNGTKSVKLKGPTYETAQIARDKDYDLSATSYRAGVGYKRSFADDWNFNGKIDYLYMELDDEDEGNIYSSGFSYTAGVTYSF